MAARFVQLGDALKRKSTFSGRFALTGVAAAALCLAAPAAWALGLGKLQVQSALGESLRAEIDITSLSPEEASNLRVRVAPPESYKAAGVDYNPILPGTQVALQRRADGRPYLRITSDRGVQEPFVDVERPVFDDVRRVLLSSATKPMIASPRSTFIDVVGEPKADVPEFAAASPRMFAELVFLKR